MEKTVSRKHITETIASRITNQLHKMAPKELIMLGKLCGMDLDYVGNEKFISNEFKFSIGDKVIANYKGERLLVKIVDIHRNPRGNIYSMIAYGDELINARESDLENL